jgi:hypothetical protein
MSDEHMDAIINDGIAFIRSITVAYGSEEGMALWDTIASTLDPDVKGKIFFAMLTGSHEDRVTLSGAVSGTNKITCIKIIRQYTGLGLVESKNAYESAGDYGSRVTLKVNPKDRRNMIDELRQNGMIVS